MREEQTDVLLAYPSEEYAENDFHKSLQTSIGGVPLGILHVASHLRANGIDALVYDGRTDFDFGLIKEHKPGTIFRLGASDEAIKAVIRQSRPKIVGVSSVFLARIADSYRFCNLVKEVDPSILVVLGGPSCSILKLDIFEACQGIDAIVLGDGEEIFLDLVRRHLSGEDFSDLDSIACRKNGQVAYRSLAPAVVKDLNALAEPDYSLVEMEKYFQLIEMNLMPRISWCGSQLDRPVSLITSRGCPYKCVFCTRREHNTTKWRAELPERLVDRIKHLKDEYNITHVYIEDDAANISTKRFEKILDLLIEKKVNITWSSPNGIRGEGLSYEFVRKCVASGCISLQIGIESGDQEVLSKIVRKKLVLREAVEGVKNCHKHNLDVGTFFIIGFPGETKRNIFRTILLALKLNLFYACRIHIGLAAPGRGSDLYKIAKEGGYIKSVMPGWKITDLIVGKPKTQTPIDVIETEEFSYRFLRVCHTLVVMVTFLTLVARSTVYTIFSKSRLSFVLEHVLNTGGRAPEKLKVLFFRCLIFPKMIKKVVGQTGNA